MSALAYPETDWPIRLFHDTVRRVPAYCEFVRRQGINAQSIKTLADLKRVPVIDKESYLKQIPLKELLVDNDFGGSWTISTSSGSSGEPFYWPRGESSLEDAVLLHDRLFGEVFETRTIPTLLIIGFAMGNWIGGTYTLQAATQLSRQGHRIVTISPGLSRTEIIQALEQLSPCFSQTILAAYPPFAKDVIDEAARRMDLADLNLNILCAGENFSEAWREYAMARIGDLSGSKIISVYGTADAGMLANETPLSIFVRRQAAGNRSLHKMLFPGASITPTFAQYDPGRRYFEQQSERLFLTVDNVLPLIRYDIHDTGRLLACTDIESALAEHQITVPNELLAWAKFPFVAVYGRSDIAASFYGLNIYPEHVRAGLERPHIMQRVTGKFFLQTKYDASSQEPSLHLSIELCSGTEATEPLRSELLHSVVESIREHSTEYNRLCQEIGENAYPMVVFAPAGSSDFGPGVKHRWTGGAR